MSIWSKIKASDVDIEILAQVIHDTGRPVSVNKLAQVVVRTLESSLREQSSKRLTEVREVQRYTPSAAYTVGDKVRWKGKLGEVKAVVDGTNPRQGEFKILTLVLPDGEQVRLVAKEGVEAIQDRGALSDRELQAILNGKDGLAIRTTIQNVMHKDARFVWFQDAQGDNWCLTEMLPEVQDEDLTKALPLLRGLLKDGVLYPNPTEEVVKAIWEQSNDGSAEYDLRAFALNVALQSCNDTHWIGNGWVLESEWQELQEREALIVPRQPTNITPPEDITIDTSDDAEDTAEEVEEKEEPEEQEAPVPEDMQAWRRNRLSNATITLNARYYYGNWLRLTRNIQRVFPPRASGADAVTFYHRFGDEEESFQAWVDWNQRRIFGSPQMYQAFDDYGIYPGAKLVVSHRGNEQEYDIRTKEPTKTEPIYVWRMQLDEDGKIQYDDYSEPRRYDINDDVFVADVRFEDREALFQQAEEVGNSIFGLIYNKAVEWRESRGRQELYVTVDELFEAIHFEEQGRMTNKATIAWELWRRLAFELVGEGRYLFRPEKVAQTRDVVPRSRTSRTREPRRRMQVKRERSLLEIAVRVKAAVNDIANGKALKPVKEDSQDYRDSIYKVRTLSIQLGFMDFKNNIINYPRPEWIRTIEDIFAIAEHLNAIKEEVNCIGGASVTGLDKLLCETHNSIDYRFVTHSRNFERLLSSPRGNRRQMRLCVQLAHLLGLVNCSSHNVRRSNLMVTDFAEDIINISHNLDAAKQLLIQKVATFAHGDVINIIRDIGFIFMGTIILVQDSKVLYPFGYPYQFRINHVHQYILNFLKSE